MAINNSKRLLSQVGSTYGERRQLSSHRIAQEPSAGRPKDFSGTSETFAPNAKYLGVKKVLPHKAIEAGKTTHIKPQITDDMRLSYLDKIIAGPVENIPPAKLARKSTKPN